MRLAKTIRAPVHIHKLDQSKAKPGWGHAADFPASCAAICASTKRGVGTIELLDDQRLPDLSDLTPAPKQTRPLAVAAAMGDVAEVRRLIRGGVDPQERDTTLWATLVADDPCMTATLLEAGASADLRDESGFTLLMEAVRLKASGTCGRSWRLTPM